ncbi:MAG: hypothetical protein GKR91_11365 [Pseudomonadales bacterium]|nr:hypothetical protein [Pseudomonadales bacterium]
MPEKLSSDIARKLVLDHQRLNSRGDFGRGINATLKAIEHLGYVQLDTLSVVERAHLHTLWNRVDGFRPDHIDKLQRSGKIFEHWAHALALLPMRDYRFSLPMMHRIASGEKHWYPKNKKVSKYVLDRIRNEGALSAKDFDDKPASKEMWVRAPSKNALEQLFIEGKLMVPYRNNFHKVYDLTERVLPDSVDTTVPNEDELCRHLIISFMRAHGFGQLKEIAYLRKGMGPVLRKTAKDMEEEGLLCEVAVNDSTYLTTPANLERAASSFPRSSFRILSPFDNAIIQRNRINELYKFDYQMECYVKKDNRKYGYFCLPLLHQNKLVGRLDAKADRKSGTLQLLHLQLDERVGKAETILRSMRAELKRYMEFNKCTEIEIQRCTGFDVKPNWN